ncbi:VWA domain-containing protein [Spirosoma taeanense]|uniref:VWA domain-containing protein n=1 Tax=Spirosoma taeanense TaxID=2735870 RepID=A0A6M5Y565_9BACT|nr:VWA domain-containing protein [Spirosoma taeanense]QJW88233.1 VWA domain-containing protein [Spirosoma taeanense]
MDAWYSLRWFDPAFWQQFRFAYPLALYLIPAILLLFALRYYLHRGAQQRLNMALGPIVGNVDSSSWFSLNRTRSARAAVSYLRYLLPGSMFMAVSLLLVTLARPQIVRERREELSQGIDIMLAVDVSSSMTETDLPPTRLAAARRVAQAFVNGRKNDRIGLVIFAGEAFSLCPLTTDYTLLKQYLSELNDRMIPASGTAIGDALARCINRMREPASAAQDSTRPAAARSKVIILLSDGDNTAGNLDPTTAARLAKAFGIRIYTIAVGRASRSQETASTVDEGILKTIAGIGEGSFFRATDASRLRAIFAQINRLEKSPVRVQVYEDVQDYYRIYLYWAIVFLLVTLLLKTTIVGNVLED